MSKINETLLKALFNEPNPQPEKKEVFRFYRELNFRIFPIQENFISFLRAQTIDKQYEYAAKIIHTLCFYANFPPSYFALTDILSVENYQKDIVKIKDTYSPRDHFLHIVNLYLLGIYIFFYDSEFYERIVLKNRFERSGSKFENAKRDCIKDFLSEWKYFCLFHDVGYSPEVLGNSNIPENERPVILKKLREIDFHASFARGNLIKQICFFNTIEILTKLIIVNFVLYNAYDVITDSHKIFKAFKNSDLLRYYDNLNQYEQIEFKNIYPFINQGKRLEKIYSNQCLKVLLPIIGPNSIAVIGTLKETGKVIFLSYHDNNSRKLVVTKGFESHSEIYKLATIPELILFDEYIPCEFELEYLLLKKNDFESIYQLADEDYLNSVFEMAKTALNTNFIGISNEYQFLEFQYTIYTWLYNILASQLIDSPLANLLNERDFHFSNPIHVADEKEITFLTQKKTLIFEALEGRYHNDIEHFCFEYLKNWIQDQPKTDDEICQKDEKDMLSSLIDQFFELVLKFGSDHLSKSDLKSEAERRHLILLEQDTSLLQLYSQVYIKLKCSLNKTNVLFSYDYETCELIESPFLCECIDEKSQELFYGRNLTQVSKEYELKYGNTVDHGMISAQYAASIFEIYRTAILQADDEQEKRLLSILLNIPGEISDSRHKYIENYNHVFAETLFAIFSHNLYPERFLKNTDHSLQNYKTTMQNPFSYLALLCDALQEWNRPHAFFPSRFEIRPNEDASGEFNILIKNNTIFIYENGIPKAQERLANNIKTLSQYLRDIDAFLKNGYTNPI